VYTAVSARNQLPGQVKEIRHGNVMAHLISQVGEYEIESVITRRSAEDMNLKPGDSVVVIIESTEVTSPK
jgi:molybdopterin-binding protein